MSFLTRRALLRGLPLVAGASAAAIASPALASAPAPREGILTMMLDGDLITVDTNAAPTVRIVRESAGTTYDRATRRRVERTVEVAYVDPAPDVDYLVLSSRGVIYTTQLEACSAAMPMVIDRQRMGHTPMQMDADGHGYSERVTVLGRVIDGVGAACRLPQCA